MRIWHGGAIAWRALLVMALLIVLPPPLHPSPRTLDLYNRALSLQPDSRHGAKLYRHYCASCHGSRAFGDPDNATPALAAQREPYLIKQLVDFVEVDRMTSAMHHLMAQPDLGRPQAWRDIAAYLRSQPPNTHPQLGDGRALQHGESVYAKSCAACHGPQGEGVDAGIMPALRGQHYSYLLLQLRSFEAQHRSNIESPLLDFMAGLSTEDLEALADYLSRAPTSPGAANPGESKPATHLPSEVLSRM